MQLKIVILTRDHPFSLDQFFILIIGNEIQIQFFILNTTFSMSFMDSERSGIQRGKTKIELKIIGIRIQSKIKAIYFTAVIDNMR